MARNRKNAVDLGEVQDIVKETKLTDEAKETQEATAKKDSKSEKIRELYSQGMSISDISRKLNVNYSFAYQVAKRMIELSSSGIAFSTNEPSKPTKADEIRRLWNEGLTIGEIAKKLESNYSYVWSVCDACRHKQDLAK